MQNVGENGDHQQIYQEGRSYTQYTCDNLK